MLRALPASLLFLSLLVPPALAKPATVAPAAPPLLPTGFAGWSLSGPAQESAAPEAADAANASVLKEFGSSSSQPHTTRMRTTSSVSVPFVFRTRVALSAHSPSSGVPAASPSRSVAARPGMAGTSCFGTAPPWWMQRSIKSPPGSLGATRAGQGSATASRLGECCSSLTWLSSPPGPRS